MSKNIPGLDLWTTSDFSEFKGKLATLVCELDLPWMKDPESALNEFASNIDVYDRYNEGGEIKLKKLNLSFDEKKQVIQNHFAKNKKI